MTTPVEETAPLRARCRAAHPLLLVQCDLEHAHNVPSRVRQGAPYHAHTSPNGVRFEWHDDDISPRGCLVHAQLDEHQVVTFMLGTNDAELPPEMTVFDAELPLPKPAFTWPDPQPTRPVLEALSGFSVRIVDAVIAREDLPPGDAEQPQPARPPLARMFAAVMRAWVHYSQALLNETDVQLQAQIREAVSLERQHVASYLEDGWARRVQSLPEIAKAIVNGQHVPSSDRAWRAMPAAPSCIAGEPLTDRTAP